MDPVTARSTGDRLSHLTDDWAHLRFDDGSDPACPVELGQGLEPMARPA